MRVTVHCPHCAAKFLVEIQGALPDSGKDDSCPECGAILVVCFDKKGRLIAIEL
jgi:hypothetical protein